MHKVLGRWFTSETPYQRGEKVIATGNYGGAAGPAPVRNPHDGTLRSGWNKNENKFMHGRVDKHGLNNHDELELSD